METCSEKSMIIPPSNGIDPLSFTRSDASPNNPPPHIHRLPVELLQHVFLLIVNDVPDCPSIFSYGDTTISANFSSPPLVLTRVCRLWRAVAHSTTGVWSRIQVGLPGRHEPLRPFLVSLLRLWLARSGGRPLTLHIVSTRRRHQAHPGGRYKPFTLEFANGDSQLLQVILAERERWETVTVMARLLAKYGDGGRTFETPRLSTLECSWWDVKRFDAPHLCRLLIVDSFLHDINIKPIPTCKNIRHLHLQSASVHAIRCTFEIFPHLESITVDVILPVSAGDPITVTHPCLQSITLPLPSGSHHRHIFIESFSGLHLPMMRRLTVVGEPRKPEVDCIVAALEAASCRVGVVDFQTDTSASEIDMYIIKSLFSVAREITLRGDWILGKCCAVMSHAIT
ncbi:hypothetical protein M405DRAFT_827220 [Rhizopogon salebrosus TDB-379]|nr:hypothetical protein M405DRAFT_827220 [Rhizopogon salebrosus TDB-379]